MEGGTRLDEMRNDLEKFIADSRAKLRAETVTVVQDATTVPDKDDLIDAKIARLLSTRYGKTCFDAIIEKTPTTSCLH